MLHRNIKSIPIILDIDLFPAIRTVHSVFIRLPAQLIIEKENIFVMDEKRAMSQDIRPLKIVIANLMPLKEDTEIQLLRLLSNTPLQVDITFLMMKSHTSKNTHQSHLNKFYATFDEVKDKKYDGMIITGAPDENLPFT